MIMKGGKYVYYLHGRVKSYVDKSILSSNNFTTQVHVPIWWQERKYYEKIYLEV